MKGFLRICALTTLALLLLPSVSPAVAAKLEKTSLILLWSPQAQFAGYYIALNKGIYRKHGIDLTIIPGGPERSAADYLRRRKADFAVLWLTTALQQRAAGASFVNVAQIIQKSSMMLVARKSSGIKTPADLNGRTVGLWGGDFAIPPRAFFNKYGLRVRETPQSYTVNLFLRGGIDAASAMWYNEYHTILNSGVNPDELTTFFLQDHGQRFPEDGIYTLDKTLRKDPLLAAAVARASLEGWLYAFDHPDEALDIVIGYMEQAKVPANRIHQKWMLERMRDLMLPTGNRQEMGRLKRADYEAVGQVLRENRLARSIPEYAVFTGGAYAAQ